MEAMTQHWTDDRTDDLAQRVDNGFAQVDRRFEQVERRFEQVDRRFERVYEEQRELRIALERNSREGREELATATTELRGEIKALGDGLNQRFDRLQQVLMGGLLAGIVTFIASQIS